jgi:tetratricopeptide (TPR) repeat protein
MRAMRALVSICILAVAAPAFADELDSLGQAIDQRPDDPKAYDAYAQAAFKAKRWDDAIRKLKIGVARIPEYPEGYYRLAYAYRQKKEWADAADYYRRYISINPAKTDPYFGLGISLEGLGDKKGASAAFSKYVSMEKSPAKQWFIDYAKTELGKLSGDGVLGAGGAPPTPVTPAQPADPYRATPPPAGPARADAKELRSKADELRKEGKLDEAVQAYKHAIEADRGNLDLYNDLGNVYFSLKRFNEASASFQDATARDPNFALGWYNLAHALRKGNRNSEAAAAYRQYMRLRPDDPDPYYGLGQTLKATGDLPGAIDAFRKYIAMEKRPEEQKWVDKARIELEALEMMKKGPTGMREPSALHAANDALDRELQRDAVLPMTGDDLIDPFKASKRGFGLRNPFPDEDGLIDPYSLGPGEVNRAPLTVETKKLREYGAALAAYRRALSAEAEDVSLRYERGAALALMNDAPAAVRAWNTVSLESTRVDAAKKSVERARGLFARR